MSTRSRSELWTLPNILSLARLGLTPVICAMIAGGFYLGAAAVFALASLSDWFDGYLARRMKVATAFGRQLDTLVDKVFVAACLTYLIALPVPTGLRPWMVSVILARELIVQAVRSAIEGRGTAFGAKMAGKLKATFQFLAIIAVLLCLSLRPSAPWLLVRDGLIWASVLLTIHSGVGYLVAGWLLLRRDAAPRAAS